jgi:hypothetical protein
VEISPPRDGGQPTQSHFVQLTNLAVTTATVTLRSRTGRLRWTIAKEGCNTPKHLGYGLEHRYARVSWQAAKNSYQCLQIGPLINQLMLLSRSFPTYLQGQMTCRHLGKCLRAFLREGHLSCHTLDPLVQHRIPIRWL